MSTKSTLEEVTEGEWLETDGSDDSVWLCGVMVACKFEHAPPYTGINVRLSRDVIDAIARLHAEQRFPHQKRIDKASRIRTATRMVLGGVSAIRPELFANAKVCIAAAAGVDVDSEEFKSEFSRALLEIACPLD